MNNFLNTVKNKNGFTLIEILIVTGVSGIIGVTLISMVQQGRLLPKILSSGLEAANSGRKVLQPIAAEIRSASTAITGDYAIDIAEENEFAFYSDADSDGQPERIRYYLENGTLKRGEIIPSGNPPQYLTSNETITDSVISIINSTEPVFEYYDDTFTGSEAPLSSPVTIGDIRMVQVSLEIDTDPQLSPELLLVTSKVSIRNLKNNL